MILKLVAAVVVGWLLVGWIRRTDQAYRNRCDTLHEEINGLRSRLLNVEARTPR